MLISLCSLFEKKFNTWAGTHDAFQSRKNDIEEEGEECDSAN